MSRRVAPALAVAALVCVLVAVVAVRPVATPGPFLRDFEAYWSAGRVADRGGDPYTREVWNVERTIPGVDGSHDEVLPFVGPPYVLAAWKALAHLPYPIAAALWYALLLAVIASLAAVCLRGSATSRSATSPSATRYVAAVATAVAFGPVTSALALGQVALTAYLGAALLSLPRMTRSNALGGACLALLQPNVALGVVTQLHRRTVAFGVVAATAVAYAIGAAIAGWSWPLHYVAALIEHGRAERFSVIQITPVAIAYGFGSSPALASLAGTVVAIAALAGAVVAWRRIAEPFARFAAVSASIPFVANFFHEHDVVVAYAAAIWCALNTTGRTRAIAFVATILVAVDWLGLAQRPTGIAQSALLAVAAACAFATLGRNALMLGRNTLAGFAAIGIAAGIFVLGATLAHAHPAPVWPDALGAFHAPAAASAAQTWLLEQDRSGLLAPNPAWALLRSLTLAGCALLTWCIATTKPTTPA